MADDDVQGEVTDANGDPVEGATVYALRTDTDPPEFVGTDTTDVSGFYQITTQFDGEVHVAAEWENSGADFATKSRPFVSVTQVGLPDINNYLEDDFGDNALTSRTNPDDGVYAHPDANVAGDVFVGRYRPEWNITSGSPSSSDGVLSTVGGATVQSIITTSEFSSGEWSFDFQFLSDPTNRAAYVDFIGVSPSLNSDGRPNNGYAVQMLNFGELNLDQNNTDLIVGSWSNDTSKNSIRVTRTSYGEFELFNNGTSVGTTTDTTHNNSQILGFANDTESALEFDNLVVQ